MQGTHMANSKLKRLIEKRNAIEALIKKEHTKHKTQERTKENRRKYLAGTMVLQWAEKDNEFSARLIQGLKLFLTRDDERALFGLPPAIKNNGGGQAKPNQAA
jgi:hypothetical protein